MAAPVLLTRARDDAEASAARLAARGMKAIALPVIEIVPLNFGALPDADVVIATSRRAFAGLDPASAFPRRRPLYAVGAATAAAARAAGFADVREAGGEAAALLDALKRDAIAGRALYLAGENRKATVEQGLAALGLATTTVCAYAARARDWSEAERGRARAAAQAGARVLHYSRRSTGLFLAQIDAAGLASAFASSHHFAVSQDAAQPLVARKLPVVWPRRPTEDDLFALLSP